MTKTLLSSQIIWLEDENKRLQEEVERLKKRLDQSEGYIYDRCLWEDYILGLEDEST